MLNKILSFVNKNGDEPRAEGNEPKVESQKPMFVSKNYYLCRRKRFCRLSVYDLDKVNCDEENQYTFADSRTSFFC